MPTAIEIRRALREAGLEVYRTLNDAVHVAERVRENLLMDAGISVHAGKADEQALRVRFHVRAQRTDFPNDGEDVLFERARRQAAPALERGYLELGAEVRKIFDPGDGQRIIDTWCEVAYELTAPSLDAAIAETRFALSIEKVAAAR